MVLELTGINQFYGQTHILWDIDLTLAKGQCTCLLGRNGVGKTTLVQTIMGHLRAASGQIYFQQQEITRAPITERAYLGIGYVPQGKQLFGQLTVEENLLIALAARRAKADETLASVYHTFPVLKAMRKRRSGDLSGGQQQQLAIGRALMLEPELLILDEPTEGIQPNIVQNIAEIIKMLNKEHQLTVLLVEQKLPFIQQVADHFYLLDRGRNIAHGSIDRLSPQLIKDYLTV